MKRITAKEEEIMNLFWEHGSMFVKDLLEYYENPKPHFNTLSTYVRELESKGFLDHYTFGNTYQYFPLIGLEDYKCYTLHDVIDNYFDKSYLSAVSTLVKEEDISIDDLKQLIKDIEKGHK